MKQQRQFSQSEQEDIIAFYITCHSTDRTAKKFQVSHQLINRVLKMNNIQKRKRDKYVYNEDFFEKIDSPEKAYIIGLLFTDGNLSIKEGRHRITLALQDRDKHILDSIANLIVKSKEKPLYFRKKEIGKDQCALIINNKKLAIDLQNLGFMNRKTFKISIRPEMYGNYFNSFVLGLMDGDGSIFEKRKTKWCRQWGCSFTGNEKVSAFLSEELKQRLNINISRFLIKKYINKKDKIYFIYICGRFQLAIFFNWLYKDSTICLNRKKIIYEDFTDFVKTRKI